MGYDTLDRLTSWTSPFDAAATTYSLDDAGNVTNEVTVAAAQTTTMVNTYVNNRLGSATTTKPGASLQTSYGYDVLNQEATRTITGDPDGVFERTTSYQPNRQPKVVQEKRAGVLRSTVSNIYDSEEHLLSRVETGDNTATRLYFYWGDTNVLADEANETGASVTRHLVDSQLDALAQETPNNIWAWLARDPRGNIATLTSDSGEIIEQKSYNPYRDTDAAGSGRKTTINGGANAAPDTTLGFQGAQIDYRTDTINLGVRQYDPDIRRFTIPDMHIAAGMDLQLGDDSLTGNRYLYAAANPLMYWDDGYGPCFSWKCAKNAAKKVGGAVARSTKRVAKVVVRNRSFIAAGLVAAGCAAATAGTAAAACGYAAIGLFAASTVDSAVSNRIWSKKGNRRAFLVDSAWNAAGFGIARGGRTLGKRVAQWAGDGAGRYVGTLVESGGLILEGGYSGYSSHRRQQ
jgi:RHS repeat-associated protein